MVHITSRTEGKQTIRPARARHRSRRVARKSLTATFVLGLAAVGCGSAGQGEEVGASPAGLANGVGSIPPLMIRSFDSSWVRLGRVHDPHAAVIATSEDRVEVWSRSEGDHLQGQAWTRDGGWGPVAEFGNYWIPNSGASVAYVPEYFATMPVVTGSDGNAWVLPMVHFNESDANLAENPQIVVPARNLGAPSVGLVGTPGVAYAGGRLYVVARGGDDHVYEKVVTPNCYGFGWCDWSFPVVTDWTALLNAVDVQSDPTATTLDGTTVDVFYRNSDHRTVHWAPGKGFRRLGTMMLPNPPTVTRYLDYAQGGQSVVSYGTGVFRVFVEGTDRNIWETDSTRAVTDFDRIDFSCAGSHSAPSATLPPNATTSSTLHLVTVDPDMTLWHITESLASSDASGSAPRCCGGKNEPACSTTGCLDGNVDLASAGGPLAKSPWVNNGNPAPYSTVLAATGTACLEPGSLGSRCTQHCYAGSCASECQAGLTCTGSTCVSTSYAADTIDSVDHFDERAAHVVYNLARGPSIQLGDDGNGGVTVFAPAISSGPSKRSQLNGWGDIPAVEVLGFITATLADGDDASAEKAMTLLNGWNPTNLPGTDNDKVCIRHGDLDMKFEHLIAIAYLFGPDTARAKSHPIVSRMRGANRTLSKGVLDHLLNNQLVVEGSAMQSSVTLCGISVDETENHMLMIESGRYLANDLRMRRASRWDGGWGYYFATPTSNEVAIQHTNILNLLTSAVHTDLKEYNSRPYLEHVLPAVTNLYTYAPDQDVRDAAGALLDYYATKIALSENGLRRVVPYRRLWDSHDHMDTGVRWFEMMTNQFVATVRPFDGRTTYGGAVDPNFDSFPTCAPGAQEALVCRGYGPDFMQYALGSYRVPVPILDMAVAKRAPIWQTFHHWTTEVFDSEPDFTLSGGGAMIDPYLSVGPFSKGNDKGVPAETVLLPTRLTGSEDRSSTAATLASSIYIAGANLGNTCIGRGIACGLGINIPPAMKRSPCAKDLGDRWFLDATGPCAEVNYGFSVLVTNVSVGGDPAGGHVLEVIPASEMSAQEVLAQLARTPVPVVDNPAASDVSVTYTTVRGGDRARQVVKMVIQRDSLAFGLEFDSAKIVSIDGVTIGDGFAFGDAANGTGGSIDVVNPVTSDHVTIDCAPGSGRCRSYVSPSTPKLGVSPAF